jgi:predicted dehydrogenase
MSEKSPEAVAPVRLVVVGAGYLGEHHVRIARDLPGATLVGFVESNDARAAEISARYGVRRLPSLEAAAAECEAASVVVPTVAHAEVAARLLEAGLDVLVEKPITTTPAEARHLIDIAASRDRILAVGHIERHNPAVDAVLKLHPAPRYVETERLGVFVGRSLDVDVVLDLMIHDIDVLLALIPEPVAEVRAIGVPVLTDRIDLANVRIAFEGGAVANLTASRVSSERMRKIRIFQRESYFSIDTQGRTVSAWKLDRSGAAPAIAKLDVLVESVDPLTAELGDFVQSVRSRVAPKVTGRDGLRALEVARRILDQMTGVEESRR